MRLVFLIVLLTVTAAGAQGYFPARPFYGMAGRDYPAPPSPPPAPFYFTGRTPGDAPAPLRPAPIQRVEPPRIAGNAPQPRPDPESRAIEHEIVQFCDEHPDEPFCGHLGSYLRRHPGLAPQ
jgi:hypothetical protein